MNTSACPRCQSPLESLPEDAECLKCTQCTGTFVPARDVRSEMLDGAEALSQGTDAAEANAPAPTHAGPIPCPGCGAMMTPMHLAEVVYDRCSQCKGLWLDAQEQLPGLAARGAPLSVGRYFFYALSLPERALRTTAGLAGGAAHELSNRLVPRAFQNSSTYTILVRNSLRFLMHDVGGVAAQAEQSGEEPPVKNFLARKAVGNFLELAGLATIHVSPMLVLAIVSDVVYGSKAYLAELAEELRKEGVIDAGSTINNLDELFEAVGHASGTTARLFDTPPFSVNELRATTNSIRQAVANIDPTRALPQSEISRLWSEMRGVAAKERLGLLQVSAAMTLHGLNRVADATRGTFTGLRLAGGMVNRHILAHYWEALDDFRREGFYATLSRVSGPYVEAVWNNFSADSGSMTEEVFSGRLLARLWRWIRARFRRKASATKVKVPETNP